MKPADWEWVRLQLSTPYGLPVRLLCDGIKLDLAVVQTRPLRYVIHIYVDGLFRGAWSSPKLPCEEQRRFMRRTERAMHTAKQLAILKPLYRAAQVRQMAAKKFVWFQPTWPSFEALKKHLVANNQVIALANPLRPGLSAEERAALAQLEVTS